MIWKNLSKTGCLYQEACKDCEDLLNIRQNYREGIHFPSTKTLLKMAEENETVKLRDIFNSQIRFKTRMMKQEFNDKFMALKAGERKDADESVEEF